MSGFSNNPTSTNGNKWSVKNFIKESYLKQSAMRTVNNVSSGKAPKTAENVRNAKRCDAKKRKGVESAKTTKRENLARKSNLKQLITPQIGNRTEKNHLPKKPSTVKKRKKWALKNFVMRFPPRPPNEMSGPKIHKQRSVTGPTVKLLSRDRIPERRLLQRTGISRKKWDDYYRRTRLLKTGNPNSVDSSVTSANCDENQPSTSAQTSSKKSTKDSDRICSLNSNETKNQRSPDDNLQSSCCQRKDRKLKRKVTFELYAIPLKKVKKKQTRDLFISLFGPEPKIMTPSSFSQKNSRRLNSCSSAPTLEKDDCLVPIVSKTVQPSNHDQCKDDSNQGPSRLITANKAPNTEETSGQLINKDSDNNNNAKKCEETEVPMISNSIVTVEKHGEDNLRKDLEVPEAASRSNCNDNNRKDSANGMSPDSNATPQIQHTVQDGNNEKRAQSLSENLLLESMEDEAIVSFHEDYFVSWIKEVKLIAHNYFLQCTQQNLKVVRNIKTDLISRSDKEKMLAQIQNHSAICKNLAEIFFSVMNHQHFQLFVICYFLRIYQQIFSKADEMVSLLPDNFFALRFCLGRSLSKSHIVNSITKKLACILNNLNFEKACVRVWRVMRKSLRGKASSNVVEKEKCNEIIDCSNTVPAPKITVPNQTITPAGAQLPSKSNTRLENNDAQGSNAQKNIAFSEISESTAVIVNGHTTSENICVISPENPNDNTDNKLKVPRSLPSSAKEDTPSTVKSRAMKSSGEVLLDKNEPQHPFLSSLFSNVSFGVVMKNVRALESQRSAELPNNAGINETVSNKFSTSAGEMQKENVPVNTVNIANLESSAINSNGSVGQARYPPKHVSSANHFIPQQPPQIIPLHEQNLYEKRDTPRQSLQPGNAVFPDGSEKIALASYLPQTGPTPTTRRRRKKRMEVPGVAEVPSYSIPANQSSVQASLNNHNAPPSNYQMRHGTATAFYQTSGSIAPGTHLQNLQVFSQNYSSIDFSQNVLPSVTPPNMYTNTSQQLNVVNNQQLSREPYQTQYENYHSTLPSTSQRHQQAQQYHQTQSVQLKTANPPRHRYIQPNPPEDQLQPSITRHPVLFRTVAAEKNWLPPPNSDSSGMLRRASFSAPHGSGFHGNSANSVVEIRNLSAPPALSVTNESNSGTLYLVPRKIDNQRRRSVQAMPSSELNLSTNRLTNSIEMNFVQQPVLVAMNSVQMSKPNPSSTLSLTLQNSFNISLPHPPQPTHSSSLNVTSVERLRQQKVSNVPNTLEINSKVIANGQYIPVQKANSNVTCVKEASVPNIFVNRVITATNNEGQPFSFHVRNASSEVSAIGTNQPNVMNISGPTHQPANSVKTAARLVEQPISAEKISNEENAMTTGLTTIKKKPRVKYTKRRPPEQRRGNISIGVRNTSERKSCDDFIAESPNENLDKESDTSSSELQIDLDFNEREEETNSVRSEERLNSADDELANSKVTGVLSNADVLKLLEGIDPASFSKDYVLEFLKNQHTSDKNENVSMTVPIPGEQDISQGSTKSSDNTLPPDSDQTSASNTLAGCSEAAETGNVPEMSRSEEVAKSKKSHGEETTRTSAKNLVVKHILPALIEKPRSISKKSTNNPKSREKTRVKSRESTHVNETATQSRNPSKMATDQQQYRILNDPENMFKIVITPKNSEPSATVSKPPQNEKTSKPHESTREASATTISDESGTSEETTQNRTSWNALHSLLKNKPIPEIEDALLDIYLERKNSGDNDRALNREALLNEANEYFKKHTKHEEICQLLDARLAVEQPRKRRIPVKEIDAAKKAFIQGEVARNKVNGSPSTTSTSSSQLTPPPTPTLECCCCSKVITGAGFSCDGCRSVTYCSESCKNKDFIDNHCNECERDDFF